MIIVLKVEVVEILQPASKLTRDQGGYREGATVDTIRRSETQVSPKLQTPRLNAANATARAAEREDLRRMGLLLTRHDTAYDDLGMFALDTDSRLMDTSCWIL